MRTGSLFSGYGGLDMAVNEVLGATTAWFVEYDKAPSKILAHHWPDVPNYGDVTAVDWSAVEPVDILTGGSPCQDLSHAGKRAGMTEGTRSNLWVAMREAIAQLRPALVVWENVRGAYSACADSEMGRCERCVDPDSPRGHDPRLRALGRVLGDLSSLGYDCRWHGLRAADVGAPHGRFRVFVVAYAGGIRRGAGWPTAAGETPGRGAPADLAGRGLLPTPTTRDFKGHNQRGDGTCLTGALMPTPRATDGTKGGPNQRGSSGDLMLPSAVTLLPTPVVTDAADTRNATANRSNPESKHHSGTTLLDAIALLPTPRVTTGGSIASQTAVRDVLAGRVSETADCRLELTAEVVAHRGDWGIYADAIARWEALTRPAPAPTQPSKKGTPQLSAAFSEWLMGLPAGHVTDVPGLSRNDQLKALGNGVVPQQAAAALRYLLSLEAAA